MTISRIYFWVRWKDKDQSLNRLYRFSGGQWKKVKGNEDRFAMLFDMTGNLPDFRRNGCSASCHNGEYMATKSPDQRADVWHWKAQRTNPMGYADDQLLTDIVKENHETTGRVSDKKSAGSYSNNFDKKLGRPMLTARSGVAGPVLAKKDAVQFTGGAKEGMVLPREVLARPQGSRGDIDAGGVWKKGQWTLELRRKLHTGHPDDVQFNPGKRYFFGIAVFNNGDGMEHSMLLGEALRLVFK
ncbi:MAG: ethylbenzene dehydrogenase-related protein [Nitrospinota bacterium]|nr:ethylbenzene dehydrogenase-related protein [Nitrospinota bacterium]